MLTYLENKYGEMFALESEREGSAIDPALYGHAGGLAYPESDPDQVFVVVEDSGSEGGFSDDRVLADWTKSLRNDAAPEVRKIFGEEAISGVILSSPDGAKLGLSDLGADAKSAIADRLSLSSSVLMVVARADKESRDAYADKLYAAWDVARQSNASMPVLAVWFVDGDPADATDALRVLGAPNSSAGDSAVPGAVEFANFGSDANVQSAQDTLAFINRVE